MKALVYVAPHKTEYRQEEKPEATTGELVIKTAASGICGSDLHAFQGHDPRRVPPLILGHEVSGHIAEGPWKGKAVVLNPLITCQRCPDCLAGRQNLCSKRELIGMNRPGALAEYVAIPERNVVPLPEGMNMTAAALTEPCATALHGVSLAMSVSHRPLPEGRVLVYGAGAVGLLAALYLRSIGCRDLWVAETNPERRKVGEAAGAGRVFDPLKKGGPERDSCVAVIDAVGAGATREAGIEALRAGGVFCHIGLAQGRGDFDFRRLTLAEITMVGTYTYTPVDVVAAVDALHRGSLGALDWVAERPLAEGQNAFEDLLAGREGAAKVVLRP